MGVENLKMDFSVKDITMGVENDNHNRVIRESAFHVSEFICVTNFSALFSIIRSGHESLHQLECSGAVKGNEAPAKGETHRSAPQLYGKSLLESAV